MFCTTHYVIIVLYYFFTFHCPRGVQFVTYFHQIATKQDFRNPFHPTKLKKYYMNDIFHLFHPLLITLVLVLLSSIPYIIITFHILGPGRYVLFKQNDLLQGSVVEKLIVKSLGTVIQSLVEIIKLSHEFHLFNDYYQIHLPTTILPLIDEKCSSATSLTIHTCLAFFIFPSNTNIVLQPAVSQM